MSQPPDDRQDATPSPNRRELLIGGAVGAALALTASRLPAGVSPPAAAVGSFELDELSFDQLQEGMAAGRWSAERIAQLYLERIDQLDRRGPGLRAVIETNPDALKIARDLDAERRAKGPRGPLHGLPILLKDNVATADRNTTTAGSLALEGSIPAQDSFVAKRLREAGAVLLGKANMSEWANFRSEMSSSGWSARGGQCRNPYALDRNPCGSSSGSGVAVAANLCAAAIGTETNGSIVCPSTTNGIVGIKPTLGLVSRTRIIPIAHSQDTAGPMARSVRDAALLLGALTGTDPEDAETAASQGKAHGDYAKFLDPNGLKGARIGVARSFTVPHPEVGKLFEAAIAALTAGGAEIVDPVEVKTARELGEPSFQVLLYEFKADLNAYLAALGPGAPVKTLAEIIAFNEREKEREMPFFGQDLLIQAEAKGPLTEKEYAEALAEGRRLAREEGIDKVMDEHKLDAILGPTGGPAWLTDHVNGDHYTGGGTSSPAAVAGYPHVTVPMGFVSGLPVGISFLGRAWSEPVLLRIAYAWEQATQHRRGPRFLRGLEG